MANLSSQPANRTNPWDPQTDHSNGHPREDFPAGANGHSTPSSSTSPSAPSTPTSPTTTLSPTTHPASISLRAFLLGATFSASLLLTTHLLLSPTHQTPLWRLPCFLTLLSNFHYLEYHATALANPSSATTTAFLLSSNGKAYNIAHGLAFLEAFLHHRFYPTAYDAFFPAAAAPFPINLSLVLIGFLLVTIGQTVRTTAMLHAGTNFNHLVQSKKKKGHVLVTGGVYRYLRHPSYFGFFWWGLGTQVVLGNAVCLVGYAVVLWRFFRRRIEKEENLLIGFFGMDYVRYRDRTRVGIPFIP